MSARRSCAVAAALSKRRSARCWPRRRGEVMGLTCHRVAGRCRRPAGRPGTAYLSLMRVISFRLAASALMDVALCAATEIASA